ncbi:MAG: hypothetical protein ABI790_08545 [Betaproteobacteria bacterium]
MTGPEKVRRTIAALVVLSVLTIVAVACSGSIYRYVQSGPVSWQLKKQVRDAQLTEVDLGKIAAFPWDELFLFGPYTGPEEICKVLSLQQRECTNAIKDELDSDGVMLLVFRMDRRIVHADLHMRYHGDFTPVPAVQPLNRSQAVFSVFADGEASGAGGKWLRLRPKLPVMQTTNPDMSASPVPTHRSFPAGAR